LTTLDDGKRGQVLSTIDRRLSVDDPEKGYNINENPKMHTFARIRVV